MKNETQKSVALNQKYLAFKIHLGYDHSLEKAAEFNRLYELSLDPLGILSLNNNMMFAVLAILVKA